LPQPPIQEHNFPSFFSIVNPVPEFALLLPGHLSQSLPPFFITRRLNDSFPSSSAIVLTSPPRESLPSLSKSDNKILRRHMTPPASTFFSDSASALLCCPIGQTVSHGHETRFSFSLLKHKKLDSRPPFPRTSFGFPPRRALPVKTI